MCIQLDTLHMQVHPTQSVEFGPTLQLTGHVLHHDELCSLLHVQTQPEHIEEAGLTDHVDHLRCNLLNSSQLSFDEHFILAHRLPAGLAQ